MQNIQTSLRRVRRVITSLTTISILITSWSVVRPVMASCDDLTVCAALVDYESLAIGTSFGAPADPPGKLLFIEDLIRVSSAPFDDGSTSLYGTMEVRLALGGMGDGKVMRTTNISQVFDFSAIDAEIEGIRFEFLTVGGIANVAVNGAALFIGAIFALPSEIAPGVSATVSVESLPDGALRGCVELAGNVESLLLGADDMWWDNICVLTTGEPGGGANCDPLADAEGLPLDACWGSPHGTLPGSLIFVDNGIRVRAVELRTSSGSVFNLVCVRRPPPSTLGWGDRSIALAAAGTRYNLGVLGANTGVFFDFWEGAGPVNLQVNGEVLFAVNSIADIPPNVALGVTFSFDAIAGPGYLTGRVNLEGNVHSLRIGGAQWAHDNVCVIRDASDIDTPVGVDVVVSPVDPVTGTTPVELTFAEVTVAGSSAVITGEMPATLAGRFVGAQSPYYEISTTAVHSGQIEVCITYVESALTVSEGDLRLFHGLPAEMESSTLDWQYDFVDVTSVRDLESNTVCGTVDHLSPFVLATSTTTAVESAPRAQRISLQQNVPNPFNPHTTITYDVGSSEVQVSLDVFDAAGRLVKSLVDGRRAGGTHHVTWDGSDAAGRQVAAGVYFYRLRAGSSELTRRMALVK